MDFKGGKESKNLDDHTGRSEVGKFLDFMFTNLNPVYAYKKIMGPRAQNLDFRGVTPGRVEDRTGVKGPDAINHMFFELLKRNMPPGELLKNDEHRMYMVDPVLNAAHDPYKFRSVKKR